MWVFVYAAVGIDKQEKATTKIKIWLDPVIKKWSDSTLQWSWTMVSWYLTQSYCLPCHPGTVELFIPICTNNDSATTPAATTSKHCLNIQHCWHSSVLLPGSIPTCVFWNISTGIHFHKFTSAKVVCPMLTISNTQPTLVETSLPVSPEANNTDLDWARKLNKVLRMRIATNNAPRELDFRKLCKNFTRLKN